jgi:hypothetical protein
MPSNQTCISGERGTPAVARRWRSSAKGGIGHEDNGDRWGGSADNAALPFAAVEKLSRAR